MAQTMSAIFEDHEPVDKHLFHEQTESLNLRVLEWRHSDDQDHHEERTDVTLSSASSLIARDTEEEPPGPYE